ncbi:MAG: dTDP-4-dehydrorhamnose 3,5-epimerase [Oscillospiraceae bacterium]|nr:dTDP-4-dehydrorhamnose 3,5-epimerase [Clostridiaceae bacterium]MDO4494468.1 dTDP-4-dehydrorhamnose 3,5-epimerase [Clostridiaceae bacterium]MDY5948806.1 dTDP-4-dehydrorhamnose 3,5-epimerase [Oscillospiraceae bacterium]
MKLIQTEIDGVFEIEPKVFGDNRGWFYESYSKEEFSRLGIDADFVQDNRSFSEKKGTLRGLHCQTEPKAQAKLVSCTRGAILDVAVDIRRGSPTFMKWISVELTAENKKMLFIPKGCLHGFVALTDNVELSYKVDDFYSPENDRSIRFDDPEIGVEWGVDAPVLSEKDKNAPLLADSDVKFNF